ncbi:histidinol phosphate phosphatase domain-containing protein [Methanogenium organophilum]|uniref:Histidinol phosphate phosphatase domain-containing protein n=1 Tax=Methanogenium organophilum TaxID=2199 RepID=A0A9X9T972_METOG|nr:histidinol phosphate phosphatase domain-containing protein [Methanogenium organophilum]WAI02126.1 histidinol phosphate phosphatase domain-containing protein [Methanogenium organophilum]
MYDLHTHTIYSDGELLPAELIRRAAVIGYQTLGITDHADRSNTTSLIRTLEPMRETARSFGVRLLIGVELTHVPPAEIPFLAGLAKDAGADIVIVHGETTTEPVAPGTNAAACACADVDVLAHPGLISVAEARLARENQVALEITARGGHNRTNGHVASMARVEECLLAVNSDSHAPSDLMGMAERVQVARGAGLTETESALVLSGKALPFLSKKPIISLK